MDGIVRTEVFCWFTAFYFFHHLKHYSRALHLKQGPRSAARFRPEIPPKSKLTKSPKQPQEEQLK